MWCVRAAIVALPAAVQCSACCTDPWFGTRTAGRAALSLCESAARPSRTSRQALTTWHISCAAAVVRRVCHSTRRQPLLQWCAWLLVATPSCSQNNMQISPMASGLETKQETEEHDMQNSVPNGGAADDRKKYQLECIFENRALSALHEATAPSQRADDEARRSWLCKVEGIYHH